ncbi:MAG: PKD domain-containing protein, partial [Spartobacteria bacterium]|nr:PKD domain-containing protein [Spartobacteria bacterium]
IDNTAVLANRALRGGGIWAVGGTVRSCTVIDNAAEGFATYAGGMYVTNNAVLVNNIIYYNTANSDPNIRLDSDVYSLYFSCTPVPPTNPAGSGNITAAPGLLDFPDSAHEYHLASNSPCRNAGNNYAWMTTDIDGQPRIQQGLVDMGADEFAPIPGGFNAAAGANATVGEGRPVSFNASASTGGGGSPLRYRWDFGDGSTPGDWQTTPTAEHTYGSAGVYTSKLIVVNNVSLDTDTRIVTVTNVPPIVNAGGPYSTYLNVPLTIAVSAIATGDYNVLKYRFDFNGQGWGAWNTAASSNWTYRTTVGQTNVYVQCGKFMDFMDPYPASTGSAIAVVTVLSNLPPVITALRVAPEENWLDTPLLVSVTAHDPDTNGLLRYSYNWSGAWSGWGASSNMSHTYTNGGAQTVQVRVRDDLGTSTVEQVGMHIIVAEAQGITRSNGHPNISWSVASNRTYLVQCAQDITLGAWSNVSTVITTSLNTLDFLVTNSAPNAIYRSVLTP